MYELCNLKFDESFYKGEEIDGFWVTGLMKRAWASQLEVLYIIDRICKKHKLDWYADWGTLLGTIRHKGFIP
jgi:lipopolysaccharide cholinephosphotransferase